MPLRVTILLPNLSLSGGVKIPLMYADGLVARGHQVTVVCGPSPPQPALHRLWQWLSRRKSFVTHQPGPGVRLRFTGHRDRRLIGDLPDADILVGTWWETVEAMSGAPAAKGRKVHFVQGHEVFSFLPLDRVVATYRLPFHKIVVSNWLRDVMQTSYGISEVSLVPNPVDLRFFPEPKRAKPSSPIVGTLYSAAPMKNSAMAIESVRLARKQVPGLTLTSFGSHEPLKEDARHEFMNFHLRPEQDEISRLYGSCVCWLFTSDSEGFGLPILESMAAGTPVIATPAGAAPELVTEQTGALVGFEPEQMAQAIVRLISMPPGQWSAMSERCRSIAKTYDLEESVAKFEAALMRVATA